MMQLGRKRMRVTEIKKPLWLYLAVLLAVAPTFVVWDAHAQSAAASPALSSAASANHDPLQNVVLANLIKMGAKAYFLGNRNGVDGWLLTQGKQVQLGYAADKNSLIIGILFGPDGSSVSAEQLKTLVDNNPELKSSLTAAMQAAGKSTVATSPGERLVSELHTAPSVTLGQATAPELLMVMDVNCPHCKATWRTLRDYVMSGKIRLRMIPVGELGTEHQTQGAILLQSKDPLSLWDRHVAGDKTALSGTPDQAHLDQIQSNDDLIIRWHIATTPYLVYRGRDGQIKIIQGEPNDPAGLVNAIAP